MTSSKKGAATKLSPKTRTLIQKLKRKAKQELASKKSFGGIPQKSLVALQQQQFETVRLMLEKMGVLEEYTTSIRKENEIKAQIVRELDSKNRGKKRS